MQTAEVIEMQKSGKQHAITKYELTPEKIAEMAKEYMALTVPEGDNKAYTVARKALTTCVRARTGTDKRRKELNADARKWISDVNESAKELIAPLAPAEAHLKAQLKAEDDRKAAIKAKEEAAEKARVDAIQENITAIRMMVTGVANMTAVQLHTLKSEIETMSLAPEVYEEFTPHAEQAKRESLAAIQTAIDARIQADKEASEQAAREKRIALREAEQEAVRKELEAKNLADKKELAHGEALLENQRRDDEVKRKAEQAKLDAERESIEKEKARIAAEEKAREDAELLAREIEAAHGIAIEMNADIDRDRAKLKAEEKAMREALRPDKEKLLKWADDLAAFPLADTKTKEARHIVTSAGIRIGEVVDYIRDAAGAL